MLAVGATARILLSPKLRLRKIPIRAQRPYATDGAAPRHGSRVYSRKGKIMHSLEVVAMFSLL